MFLTCIKINHARPNWEIRVLKIILIFPICYHFFIMYYFKVIVHFAERASEEGSAVFTGGGDY